MATFNKNTSPSPISPSTWDSGQSPIPDIGAQFFLNCSVIDFSVSADWASQGGSLTVNLLEDTLDESRVSYSGGPQIYYSDSGNGQTQKLRDPQLLDPTTGASGSIPIINSPHSFRVLSSTGEIIFKYDGIIESISRTAETSAGKIFNVQLASPLKLLENCSIIMSTFPGYGYSREGAVLGYTHNGYYQRPYSNATASEYWDSANGVYLDGLDGNRDSYLDPIDPDLRRHEIFEYPTRTGRMVDKRDTVDNENHQFGSNNRHLKWEDVYNLQNVFGVFENESHGLSNYAAFGGSRRAAGGLRFDMICYALHELINNTVYTNTTKRKFGGNIISGGSTYNLQKIIDGEPVNPYFYGLDILTFYNQMINNYGLSPDYIYEGDLSSNLLEFISTVCSDANLDFIIELERCQDQDSSSDNYWNGTQIINFNAPGSLYDKNSSTPNFPLYQSYQYSRLGGVIRIKLLDRRIVDPNTLEYRPFSNIAFGIIRAFEQPDYGDYTDGSSRVYTGLVPNSFNKAFSDGFGTYLDPLDDDYLLVGTDGSSVDASFRNSGTTGYGGLFPSETKEHQNQALTTNYLITAEEALSNAKNTQINLKAATNSAAKMVIGGFQSRIDLLDQYNIYHYWGDIKIPRVPQVVPGGPAASFSELQVAQRSIPVITPILPHDDMVDFILIDMQHLFPAGGNAWLENVAPQGVYAASLAEIRAAMAQNGKQLWLDFLNKFKPCILYSLQRAAGINVSHQLLIRAIGSSNNPQDPGGSTNPSVDSADQTNSPAAMRKEGITSIQNPGSARISPSQTNQNQDPSFVNIKKWIDGIHGKISEIGNQHYGKSWVAWSPQATVKVNEDVTNFGQYEHSWKPASDGYLEPSVYNEFLAPKQSKFLNKGRMKSYAVYPSQLVNGDRIIRGISRSETIGLDGGRHFFNFSNQEGSQIEKWVDSRRSVSLFKSPYDDLMHTEISVEDDFTFIPYDYFYWYDRSRRPLIKNDGGTGAICDIDYNSLAGEVTYPILAIDTNYAMYSSGTRGVDIVINYPDTSTFNKSTQETSLATAASYCKFYNSIDYTEGSPYLPGVASTSRMNQILCNNGSITAGPISGDGVNGISNSELIYEFLNLYCPDHGVNCFTFTKFTTDRVFFPKPSNTSFGQVELTTRMLLNRVNDILGRPTNNTILRDNVEDNYEDLKYFPRCAVPFNIGLPQQSQRHRYGPWFTDHNFIHGGKVEVISDDGLVPENYIFPIYGTLASAIGPAGILQGGDFTEQLSGYNGMNYAGQAIANSIDGYGQFTLEEGSITLAGAPAIRRIGDGLYLGGPYVTELSVRVSAQGVETTYSFNTASNKAGKTAQDVVKKLRNISTVLTGGS